MHGETASRGDTTSMWDATLRGDTTAMWGHYIKGRQYIQRIQFIYGSTSGGYSTSLATLANINTSYNAYIQIFGVYFNAVFYMLFR